MHISHLLHGFCHLTLSNEHHENAGTQNIFLGQKHLCRECWKYANMHVERIGTPLLNLSVLGKLYQPHSVICGSDFLKLFEEFSSKDNGVGQNTFNSPDRVLQNYSQACSILGSGVCQKVHTRSKSFSRQLFSKMILKVVNTPRFGQFCDY